MRDFFHKYPSHQPGRVSIDLEHGRAVRVESSRECLAKVVEALHTDPIAAKGLAEGGEVGVSDIGAHVWQALRAHVLPDHLIPAVGPDDDRQRQLPFHGHRHLFDRHLEAAIPGKADHGPVGRAQLGADRERQTESHRGIPVRILKAARPPHRIVVKGGVGHLGRICAEVSQE